MANKGDPSPEPAKAEPPGTDPIRLSPSARAELDARTNELLRIFGTERNGLQLPRESPLLTYLDSDDWRQTPILSEWLSTAFEDFLKKREVFLHAEGGPYASRLSGILRLELHLAAWLRETHAIATADLLVRDMVELAVYAGTEPGPSADRLWKLDLPLVLAFPSLVRGEPMPNTGARMRLGAPAREAIVNWLPEAAEKPTDGEEVRLDDLYAYWTEGQYGRPPFLALLQPFQVTVNPPEWTGCPTGRLCRWLFFGEGLRSGPVGKQEKQP
jgi:hypothetical protein